MHERDREVYNISIAKKESERELQRVQDELVEQKNIILEKNREVFLVISVCDCSLVLD